MTSASVLTIRSTLVLLVAIALAGRAAPLQAQLAPWQQPPRACQDGAGPPDNYSSGPAPADGPTTAEGTTDGTAAVRGNPASATKDNPWACEGDEQISGIWGYDPGHFCDLALGAAHDRFWFRSEFLAWWAKGFATPPLLTTSPLGTSTTQAGVLGNSTTSILYGGRDVDGGFHPGERLSFGAWLGNGERWGLEGSYLQLSRQGDVYNTSPGEPPIAARPFFNVQSNAQDALLVNYPGTQGGAFSAASSSELQAAEFVLRRNLTRRDEWSIDLTAGYRYQQLDDNLLASDTLSFSGTAAALPAGTILTQADRFDTLNVFSGGQFGIHADCDEGPWSLSSSLKIAIGETFSKVTIDGSTETTASGTPTTIVPGGVLALPSNSGKFDSQRFAMIPEFNLTFGWNFTSWLRGTVGYDLLYWPGVARPGDQIDPNLDPRQFPPSVGTNFARPQFTLRTSDYWAQGFNVGFDVRF